MCRIMFHLVILICLQAIAAKDIIVDPDASSQDTFPSLTQALSDLLIGQNLEDDVNTITLMPTTLETPQYFSSTKIFGTLAGSGSLTITYANVLQALDSANFCDQLPTLILSDSSFLDLEGLTAVSFEGLNIQFIGSSNQNQILSTSNVRFSNFCFNSSEPSHHIPDPNYKNAFIMSNVATFEMTKGTYLFDGLKMLQIEQTLEIIIDNLNLVGLSWISNNFAAAFNVSNPDSFTTEISMSNLQVICDAEGTIIPAVLWFANGESATISNFSLSECHSTGTTSDAQSVFSVEATSTFVLKNASFSQINFGVTSYRKLLYISSTSSISISDLNFENLNVALKPTSLPFYVLMHIDDHIVGNNNPISTAINGLNVVNSFLGSTTALLRVYFENYDSFGDFSLQNSTFSNITSRYQGVLIYFQVYSSNTTALSAQNFKFAKIDQLYFAGNNWTLGVLFSFFYENVTYVPLLEALRLELSNIYINQSSLNQTKFFQLEGFLCSIKDFSFISNSLISASYLFFMREVQQNSFFMSNGTVSSLTLAANSYFIQSNASDAPINQLDAAFRASATQVYSETKPFIIYNCSFSHLTLTSGSTLLDSTNPMIIIQDNTITNVTLSSSQLFNLGNYLYPFTPQSIFFLSGAAVGILLPGFAVLPYFDAQTNVFGEFPEVFQIFTDLENRISSIRPTNSIYFITIQGQKFENITTDSSSASVIAISDFSMANSTIAIFGNIFQNFTVGRNDLFSINNVIQGILFNNTLSEIIASGYVLSISSNKLDLVIIDTISVSNTSGIAFFEIEGVLCDQILLEGLQVQNAGAENIFMSIECGTVSDQITLQASKFENITQVTSSITVGTANKILSILNSNATLDNSSTILIKDNIFTNISINNLQGFTQFIFTGSFAEIVSLSSNLVYSNNTCELFSGYGFTNYIIMSAPNISFFNSSFKKIATSTTYAIFSFIVKSMSIDACNITDISNSNSNGIGTIVMSNPTPQKSVQSVLIQNSVIQGTIGPKYGVFYIPHTSINMVVRSSNFTNNQVSVEGVGMMFNQLFSSNITFIDCYFEQSQTVSFPAMDIIHFDSSMKGVYLEIANSTVYAAGTARGSFIGIISSTQEVVVQVSNLTFMAAMNAETNSQTAVGLSLFKGDYFKAIFDKLSLKNLTYTQTSLIVVNCDRSLVQTAEWNMQINQSNFENLSFTQSLVLVTADDVSQSALDNLTIMLEGTSFSNIVWLESTAAGIIESATTLIGKSQGDGFSINIVNCTFTNMSGQAGLVYTGVESMYDSIAWLNNNTFSWITASSMGAILYPSAAQFSNDSSLITTSEESRNIAYRLTANVFANLTSQSGGIVYYHSKVQGLSLYVDNNSFTDINCSQDGCLVYAKYEAPTPNSPIFKKFEINLHGNAISAIHCQRNGAIVHLYSPFNKTSLSTSTTLIGYVTFAGNNFSNITSQNGGVLYEYTPNNSIILTATSNNFQSLFASLRGGAFYANKPTNTSMVNNNSFSNVTAGITGGIQFALAPPANLSIFGALNQFSDRSSSQSAFAPTNLRVTFVPLSINVTLPSASGTTDPPFNPTFSNLTSYSLTHYLLHLTLVYQGVSWSGIAADESQKFLVTLYFINQNSNVNIQKYVGSNCSNSTCVVDASSISLSGREGDIILVNATYESEVYTQFQQFYIKLRGCVPGEINDTLNQKCVYCEQFTYSLNTSDKSCSTCPQGANCFGGAEIYLDSGYWRSLTSPSALLIIPCNDSGQRCYGGHNNTCREDYGGQMCLQCNIDANYLPIDSSQCSKCDGSTPQLIAIGTLMVLGSLTYQIIIVITTFKGNSKIYTLSLNSQSPYNLNAGAFIVIFTTFSQILSLVSEFNVGYYSQVIDVSKTAGNPNSKVFFSMVCLFYLRSADPFQAFQLQIFYYILSPLLKLICAIGFETSRYLYLILRKKGEKYKKQDAWIRIGAVAAVVIVFDQPSIIGILCDYFYCTQLDPYSSETFVKRNKNVQCDTEEYNNFKNIFVIPALIIWAFVIPAAIFLILHYNRKRLMKSKKLRITLGSFYNNYTKSAYYWGILIMVFKTVIYMFDSLLTTSETAKGCFLIITFYTYYALLNAIAPYSHRNLQRADNYCIMASICSMVLIFLRENVENSVFQEFCNFAIVVFLVFAQGYLVYNLVVLYFGTVSSIISKIKQKFRDRKEKKRRSVTIDLNDSRKYLQEKEDQISEKTPSSCSK